MLITLELLTRATQLTLADIRAALSRNGYSGNDDMVSAQFLGMNTTGTFVYEIQFDAGEEELGRGRIYVELRRVPLKNDWNFYAEY